MTTYFNRYGHQLSPNLLIDHYGANIFIAHNAGGGYDAWDLMPIATAQESLQSGRIVLDDKTITLTKEEQRQGLAYITETLAAQPDITQEKEDQQPCK
jgi:hypothetical protein